MSMSQRRREVKARIHPPATSNVTAGDVNKKKKVSWCHWLDLLHFIHFSPEVISLSCMKGIVQ